MQVLRSRRSSRTTGARSRTAVRGAAVAVVILVAGTVPGAGAADGEQTVAAELAYTCEAPAGQEPVRIQVRIAATLPEAHAVGEPVQAKDVSTTVILSEATRSELALLRAAEVTGASRLTVAVAQDEHTAEAVWAGTAAQPVPVPDSGEIALSTSGLVPTVTAGDTGGLTFTAGRLTVDLTPRRADGTPTEPAVVPLTCTPDKIGETLLATVEITGGDSPSAPPPTKQQPAPTTGAPRPDGPRDLGVAPPAPNDDSTPAAPPPCVGDTVNPFAMVAYITGYSNVAKLRAASEVPLSCAQLIDVSKKIVPKPDGLHLVQHATGVLDHEGRPQMPPAPATFLTYGFMPTTAMMELTQLDTMTIDSDILLAKSSGLTHIRVPLRLRLFDVKVNGVPLDVGPDCRTTGPLYSTDPDPAQDTKDHVVLTGVLKGPGNGYQLVTGGVLTSTMTIPPFSGCGVDEDLDPLFTSSVSGPGNYLKQVQAAPCASGNPRPDARYCTPDHQPVKVPKPER
ncbi:DUF6801 domain-containing protein [Streptomyces sp. CA-251247]|uniref:DUF6801 domain-containing protein n=1 Tax=Streptomyces sp. CA-251247 TaxID=3240062 RepID=UPI003D8C3C0A